MSIATELTRIQTAKADIKSAIEAKGVTVPSNALIDDYDTYIAQISGGGGSNDLKDLLEKDITSVDIPDGTTKIGSYAFIECTSLASVSIPNSVTRIENDAFNTCSSLTSITIPNNVTSIGNGAFAYCTGLTSVSIGTGVTNIGPQAFRGCSGLTSVTIPSNVTVISQQAFQGCTHLTSVTVEATTPPTLGTNAFDNTNNCPIYVPSSSVNAYKAATNWSTYASRIQAIIVPGIMEATFNVTDTSSATNIMYSSSTSQFSEIEIDGVVQPSVVDAYTFSTTGQHTVKYTLADPTQIGSLAFGACTELTGVTIPNTVTSIGDGAFNMCTSLASVTIPNSVTSIGMQAFYHCSFTEITIPSGVTSIGMQAFNMCTSLASVTVEATTPPTLDSYAFDNNATGRMIYVPASSVSTYKAASGWSTYAADIEAIS